MIEECSMHIDDGSMYMWMGQGVMYNVNTIYVQGLLNNPLLDIVALTIVKIFKF